MTQRDDSGHMLKAHAKIYQRDACTSMSTAALIRAKKWNHSLYPSTDQLIMCSVLPKNFYLTISKNELVISLRKGLELEIIAKQNKP